MEVLRRLGEHELLVETSEPCGIFLDDAALDALGPAQPVPKKALLRYLSNGDQYLPLTLAWELLDSCNLSCPFCYIVGHSNNKVVRFDAMRPHLSHLVESGVLFCTLTGGEATIHPDFIEIYSFLKKRGVIVEVFTNGLAVDDAMLDTFSRLPPSEVEVSIYTLDDQRFRDIYRFRREGGAGRVLENVLRLRNAGVPVRCKTFLNKVTAVDIDAVRRWCAEHEIEHYDSQEMVAGYDGADLGGFALEGPPKPAILNGGAVCLPCGTKNYGSALDSAFRLYPCPSIRLPDCRYDIRELGVAKALSEMKRFMRHHQDTRIQGSGCASCIAYATPIRGKLGELVGFSQADFRPDRQRQ